MNLSTVKKWPRLALLNLAIVALYGTLMRYKIAFDFPFFDQKNLRHAHSHFAFAGWISHVLYSGLALCIAPFVAEARQKKYRGLIILNLACAAGMLAAFTVQGYKAISILFSTASIFVAIAYACIFTRDAANFPKAHPAKPWALAGLLLNVLSSAGPFFLAYMLASKSIQHHYYLGSVYYYLHFQYSGWFFFGSMALAAARLPSVFLPLKKYFLLLLVSVFPTFFLSILWAALPMWLYVLTVAASLLQLAAWAGMLRQLWLSLKMSRPEYPRWVNFFFYAAALALTLKFTLQAISVIPSLSQLVFGIRPIVIAYLHLVLLGVYSLFLIGYLFAGGFIKATRRAAIAAFTFFAGVVLNELLLGVQGFTAFFYLPVPHINEALLATALILLGSAAGLFLSQRNSAAT